MAKTRRSFSCPVCGEEVPAGTLACPECGACEKSGWNDDAISDGLDLPDHEFDYDRYLADEFGAPAKKRGMQKVWLIAALILVVALAWGLIGGCLMR